MLQRGFSAVRHFFRTNFVTGFLIAVPFAVTIAVLAWAWQQIDGPLSSFFKIFGPQSKEGPWGRMYHALMDSNFKETVVPLIGFLIMVLAVTLLGVIMRSFIGRKMLKNIESGVGKLPVIGMLYGSVKQLGDAFISHDGKSKFQRAVAVQFPCAGSWAIGFVTGPGENVLRYVPKEKNTLSSTKTITVFVPTSPLPTAGFMLVVRETETMELDMSVQDALKMVVSGGMLAPIDSGAEPLPKPGDSQRSNRISTRGWRS